MRFAHRVQTTLLRLVAGVLAALPRRSALVLGAALGALLGALGVRRRVAAANLARAFPERDDAWRARVLREHYRELGRTAADYARLPRLVHGPEREVFASWRVDEAVSAAHAMGRGVILITGHFGHFELIGARIGRSLPVAFMVKPLSNPGAEAWLTALRHASGVETLTIGAGVRGAIQRLRAGGVVAMLADQDARRDGVFVPFFGVPASTPIGPAYLSLATGAPIVFGTCVRAADGRYDAVTLPPIVPAGDPRDPKAVLALTARHTALLEAAVREHPESWFWLHKRWKTAPPTGAGGE